MNFKSQKQLQQEQNYVVETKMYKPANSVCISDKRSKNNNNEHNKQKHS